jgi:hypothetical protein
MVDVNTRLEKTASSIKPLVDLKGERLFLWSGNIPTFLVDPSISLRITASPNFNFETSGVTLEDIQRRLEELSPFLVTDKALEEEDKVITLKLKPATLEGIPSSSESTKTPDRFVEDIITSQFLEEAETKNPHRLVVWVKNFIDNLELPPTSSEKTRVIYNALLADLRENKGGVNELLVDYLTSLEPKSGLRFQKSGKPICQHLASLLAFCFVYSGIPARSTRIYEQDDYFYKKGPKGVLAVKDNSGIRGIDTLAMKLKSSPQESVHAWTEALINGHLIPFDITFDVDHPEEEPKFCGTIPPVPVPKSLAEQSPNGMFYHVYPLEIPWVNITQVEEIS